MKMLKVFLGLSLTLMAVLAQAQFTLQVTSPLEGDFLGFNNSVKFLVQNATEKTTIKVTATGPGGSTVIQQDFLPNQDNKIDGSIALNFNESSPSGAYVIQVDAFDSSFTAAPVIRNVTVDVTKPKILEFNPIANGSIKGPTVSIVVKLQEFNLKEWRVKIDGNDIPNNTGTTLDSNDSFEVSWTVSGFPTDGSHSIEITVKDKAENQSSKSFSIRLDRLPPSITIAFPRSDTQVRPNSDFSVIVDISDPNGGLIDITGVDVIIRRLDGSFLYRVPRVNFQPTGNGSFRWTGRVRKKSISLPSSFKIVVNGIDRAGNPAIQQEVVVDTSRGRGAGRSHGG